MFFLRMWINQQKINNIKRDTSKLYKDPKLSPPTLKEQNSIIGEETMNLGILAPPLLLAKQNYAASA